jgi:tetratricopeptide (TPR) repeat protein
VHTLVRADDAIPMAQQVVEQVERTWLEVDRRTVPTQLVGPVSSSNSSTRAGSHRLAANAMAGALRTAAARGDWDESERLVERVRPLAERFGGEILGRYLSGHALLLIDGPHQDLDDAQRLIEQALEMWRELENPASELRALNELGLVSSRAGRPAQADRWYEDGLALARRVGDTSGEWMLLQNQAVLAHREARAGRADDARVLELYRSSLDRRRRLGLPYVLSLANLAQAQAQAQAEAEVGHLDDGRRNATEALRTAGCVTTPSTGPSR